MYAIAYPRLYRHGTRAGVEGSSPLPEMLAECLGLRDVCVPRSLDGEVLDVMPDALASRILDLQECRIASCRVDADLDVELRVREILARPGVERIHGWIVRAGCPRHVHPFDVLHEDDGGIAHP